MAATGTIDAGAPTRNANFGDFFGSARERAPEAFPWRLGYLTVGKSGLDTS